VISSPTALRKSYPPGGKRLLVDDGSWYRTLRRNDVALLTDPIARITRDGVLTEDGTHHDIDVLVYATGFHASRFLWPMEIRGKGGRDLREDWGDEPRAYLGVVVPGYPNLFCLYGPNTNTLTGSNIIISECGVRYILGCIKLLLERDERSLECRQDVHAAYNQSIDEGNLQVAWGVANVPSWYKNKAGRVTQAWPFKVLADEEVFFWGTYEQPLSWTRGL
jgi:4-hydroxyacetophenone monooxygenase